MVDMIFVPQSYNEARETLHNKEGGTILSITLQDFDQL